MGKKEDIIISSFARLDQGWAKLEAFTAGLSDEQLRQSPAVGEWSVLHIIRHLMLTEYSSTAYLRKKTQGTAPLPKINWTERIKKQLLRTSLRSSFKYKAPKPVEVPALPEEMTLALGIEDWKNARNELRKLLEGLPDSRFEEVVFKHPLFGRISLATMLDFMAYHQDRHFRQMKRVVEKI